VTSEADEVIRALEATISGTVVRPGIRGYDAARRVWNGRIDRHPEAIVRAESVDDVRRTIDAARRGGVALAVRGGGHNVSGIGVGDGLVLDLSGLRALRVDPHAATAEVGAGHRWGDVDRATQAHGLAVPGGTDSEVGVGGLTLGGGNGWLMGALGATVDNLLGVEMVLADGTIRTASATDDEDLFWAVRGGGGNFGVATSFTYRLHPVGPQVIGGMIAYPWSHAHAALRLYRDVVAGAPDQLTAYACLLTLDDAPVVAIALCWSGPLDGAERFLAPLRALPAVIDQVDVVPFVDLQAMMDEARPPGRHCAMRSHFMSELSDGAIDAFIDAFGPVPSPLSVSIIEHCHGAIMRTPVSAMAFALRDHAFHVEHIAFWERPGDSAANLDWVTRCYKATAPLGTGEVYVNSLDSGEQDRVPDAYGPNYDRLRALKSLYDPDNLFHTNQNITPQRQ
jgi:FAD/FMN-containing dehydrogenase